MLNETHWILLAGAPAPWDEETRTRVAAGELLTDVQVDQHRRGRRDAQLVKTLYGFSVRSGSGLDDFAILYGGRNNPVDKSLYACLRFGVAWALQQPNLRSFIAPRVHLDDEARVFVADLVRGT